MTTPMPAQSAEEIAALSLHDNFRIQLAQTEHRIELVARWGIGEEVGAKVLELGCGQGDCTAVLAAHVGPDGHVTAVDPGPLTYGRPYTLGEAQDHLSAGPLGARIGWRQADPLHFLAHDNSQYDFAVLAHCIWYFSSLHTISDTFRALATRTSRVYIAEWSLSSTSGADSHILAALAQASLECRKPSSVSNVRTVMSPQRIKEIAEAQGWVVESEGLVTPGIGVLDGRWEVGTVMEPGFVRQIEEHVKDEREKDVVIALRDAVEASFSKVENGIKQVRSMDVWCAALKRSTA